MRPQLKFKDKIDNSSAPFVPKLITKPNALKPLPDALINLHQKGQQKGLSTGLMSFLSHQDLSTLLTHIPSLFSWIKTLS